MVQISHDILTYINAIFFGLTLGSVELADKIRRLQAKDIYTFLLQTEKIIFKRHNKTTFSLKKKNKQSAQIYIPVPPFPGPFVT